MKSHILFSFKKQRIPTISFMIIMCIAIIMKISLYILKEYYGIYLFYGNIRHDVINLWLNILIILTLAFIVFIFIHKIKFKIIVICIAGITILATHALYEFGRTYPKYFYFSSPDDVNILIIEEDSWLLGGSSNFYIKENTLFVRKLKQNISTDDGYKPFSYGDYEISWIDSNTARLSYGFGQSNIVKTEIIKLK